jgi:hypothetical protein
MADDDEKLMTGEELSECLRILRWSALTLAGEVLRDHKQVRRWLAGSRVPADVAAWLRKLAEFHLANPSPRALPTPRRASDRRRTRGLADPGDADGAERSSASG